MRLKTLFFLLSTSLQEPAFHFGKHGLWAHASTTEGFGAGHIISGSRFPNELKLPYVALAPSGITLQTTERFLTPLPQDEEH